MDDSQRKSGAPLSAGTKGEADRRLLPELEAEYKRFLAVHADRSIRVGGHTWHYLAGGCGSDAVLMLPGGSMCPDSYFRLIGGWSGSTESSLRRIRRLDDRRPVSGLRAILDAEGVSPRGLRSVVRRLPRPGFVRGQPERVNRLVLSHCAPRHLAGRRSMAALAALFVGSSGAAGQTPDVADLDAPVLVDHQSVLEALRGSARPP
jgi:hypothetical protein